MLWCSGCRAVSFEETSASCARCGGPMEPLTERTLIGWTLSGRYRIERLLGRGGMGAVYEATQLKLSRRVAVKVLLPHVAVDRTLLARFLREAELVGKLNHPGIIEVIDFDAGPEGLPYLVMEYLEGRTLRSVLGSLPRGAPLPLFGSWMGQIGAALEVAHRAGIVHRDLKPENVMLVPYADGTERTKLLDFGLARLAEDGGSFVLTTSSVMLGTPFYMAPEQFRGEPADARTDIYSLGVMAYELLTGEVPFPAKSIGHLAQQHLNVAPPQLAGKGVPEPIAAAISRALAKAPAERWGDVRSFCRALEDACGTSATSTPTIRFSAPERPALESQTRETSPTVRTSAPPRPAAGRRRMVIGALAVLLVALGGGLAWRFARRPVNADAAARAGFHRIDLPAGAGLADLVGLGSPEDGVGLFLFRPGSVGTWSPAQGFVAGAPLETDVEARVPSAAGIWLSGSDHRTLRRFDPAARRFTESVAAPVPFAAAAVLGDGRFGLLVATPPEWLVIDRAGSPLAPAIPLGESFIALALAPDGSRVAFLGSSSVSVRALPGLEPILEIPAPEPLLTQGIGSFSPDGRLLAFGFRTLAVYDTSARRLVASLPAGGWLRGIGWLPDGALSAVDDRGTLHLASDPAAGWSLALPAQAGTYVALFDPRALRWAVASRDAAFLWEVRRPPALVECDFHRLETWSLAISPKAKLVAVSGKDRDIALVDLDSGRLLGALSGHTDGVTMVRFDAEGRLASTSDDGTIRVWDVGSRKLVKTIEGHRSLVNAFTFTPDGKGLVSVSSDKAVKLWSWPEMALARVLGETPRAGASVAFLPDDPSTLLVGDWSGNASLFTGPGLTPAGTLSAPGTPLYALCGTKTGWWAASSEGKAPGIDFIARSPFTTIRRVSDDPAFACAALGDGSTAFLQAGAIAIRNDRSLAEIRALRFSPVHGGAIAVSRTPPRLLAGLEDGRLLSFPLEAR